jgi:hypothetical protein
MEPFGGREVILSFHLGFGPNIASVSFLELFIVTTKESTVTTCLSVFNTMVYLYNPDQHRSGPAATYLLLAILPGCHYIV